MRHSWSLIWTTIRYLARKQKLVMFASWSIVKFDVLTIYWFYLLPSDSFFLTNITIWQLVVLETKTAKAATQDILTTHCIPSAVSEDLKSWGKLGAGCRLVQPKRSYNPSGTRKLDFIDEYISHSTRSAERVPLQVRFCMLKSGS